MGGGEGSSGGSVELCPTCGANAAVQPVSLYFPLYFPLYYNRIGGMITWFATGVVAAGSDMESLWCSVEVVAVGALTSFEFSVEPIGHL